MSLSEVDGVEKKPSASVSDTGLGYVVAPAGVSGGNVPVRIEGIPAPAPVLGQASSSSSSMTRSSVGVIPPLEKTGSTNST